MCRTSTEIMGRKSYPLVSDVPEHIDIVDIFRRSEDVLSVVKDAVGKDGVRVIWMQKGIYNREAENLAKENSIDVVYNRCMLEEHQRLFVT